MIELALIIVLAQQPQTVAVQVAPDAQVEVIATSDAEAQFKQLCADGTDDRRLHALATALNPMPNWVQFVMNGDASVCNRNPNPIILVPIEKQGRRVF